MSNEIMKDQYFAKFTWDKTALNTVINHKNYEDN